MSILPILQYPDERLKLTAKPVIQFDSELQSLINNMAETMYQENGIGLAATQVNVQKQIIVIDLSEKRNQLCVYINPEIVWKSESSVLGEEGCLSVPDLYENVDRSEKICIRAVNEHAVPFEIVADGLLARCIQHEIDHLSGKLFLDYLSSLKQSRYKSKRKKIARTKS